MENNTVNDRTLISDLIQINNDRIAGYQKAVEIATRLHLEHLNNTFVEFMNQSEVFIEELKLYLAPREEDSIGGTMISGKLFRIWMEINPPFQEMMKGVYYAAVSKVKMPLHIPIRMLLTMKAGKSAMICSCSSKNNLVYSSKLTNILKRYETRPQRLNLLSTYFTRENAL